MVTRTPKFFGPFLLFYFSLHKTIIPLVLVEYEMIIANSALRASKTKKMQVEHFFNY